LHEALQITVKQIPIYLDVIRQSLPAE
jgi:hypothetical protein